MLVLFLQIVAALNVFALIAVVAMMQMERYEHYKQKLAISAIGLLLSGCGIIYALEEIQPFIWDKSRFAEKKKNGKEKDQADQAAAGNDGDGKGGGGGGSGGGSRRGGGGGGGEKDGSSSRAQSAENATGSSRLYKNRFTDCEDCPEMVILRAGLVDVGAEAEEQGAKSHEYPRVTDVQIKRFAIGRFEITRRQFAMFVKAANYEMKTACQVEGDTTTKPKKPVNYMSPGFIAEDWHPAVCVSWDDAQAYVGWLSTKTGHKYRLPSASEWEYAARAGAKTPYHTGGLIEAEEAQILRKPDVGAAPVGSFSSNSFGLHDMHGNAAEWVEDCWADTLKVVPSMGRAWTQQIGCQRVVKGGSWSSQAEDTRIAAREAMNRSSARNTVGFRVAREMGGSQASISQGGTQQ